MTRQPPDLAALDETDRRSVPAIVLVDYGAGNMRSVQRALEAVGQRPLVSSDPRDLEHAEGIVLPGVGSAQDAMRALARLDLIGSLQQYATSGRPFLGVCVGQQLLFDGSEEGGGVECLRILPGTVRRFEGGAGLWCRRSAGIRSPCATTIRRSTASWNNTYFYFVHLLHRPGRTE